MNVLLLVDWTYPCDHQFLTNVYAHNMVDRGHRITWVMRPDDPSQEGIERETWNSSDVYVLPDEAFDPVRNYLRYQTGRIASNPLFSTGIDFDEIDLVHVRNDLSMGLAAVTLADSRNLPFVHQISHLKSETLIEGARRGVRPSTAWVKGTLGKSLRRTVSRSADVVLPISEAMKEYLRSLGYGAPMEVLPTGASSERPDSSDGSFGTKYGVEGDHVLVYVGSMAPIRRLEFLFDVLDHVDEPFRPELVMVGGRSNEHVSRLRYAARKKGVSSSVTFTGWIEDRTAIRRAISGADIGVSPLPTDSILRTNAPIKTLEYMGLGTPVVATATPDQQSVLEASGAGLAVDFDPAAFSDAIEELLSSPERRRQMSERGTAWIDANRNFDELTRRTERIYEAVLQENEVPRSKDVNG